ncbi:MAG: hypothetical protein ACW99G_15090 [Candidatus Thorarchaeota archaeon]
MWVLASIVLADLSEHVVASSSYEKNSSLTLELSKYKNIYQVISTGDYINHAIFLDEELIEGIKKLLTGDYIKIENDNLKPSRKTSEYYKSAIGERKRIARDTAIRIFAKLLEVKLDWL